MMTVTLSTATSSRHKRQRCGCNKVDVRDRFIFQWLIISAFCFIISIKYIVKKYVSISKKLVAFFAPKCYVTKQYLKIKAYEEATCQEPANTRNPTLHVKTIDHHLGQVDLDKIARNSKFYQRKPQKIKAAAFIKSLCSAAYQGIFSYSKVAFLLGLLGFDISKQGISERINRNAVAFIRQVLQAVIQNRSAICLPNAGVFKTFGNIFVQDSTCLSLPRHLADAYPGPKNQTSKTNAVMKIQAVFNLLNERLSTFSLSPFTRTDQAASKDILHMVKKGDLVIRDLGYFVLSVFEELIQKGAFFLSRYRNDVTVYCPKSGQKIELLKLVKNKSSLDINVLLGSTHRLPVRLVALPVPEHIANERRRKAKNNRDRRCNPSKESLELLGWEIFVTNVDQSIWTASTLWDVYTIRWRIEIIFKAWKSHLSIDKIPQRVNQNELEVFIYAHLLNITFFHTFFDQLHHYMIKKYNRHISMLKIASLFDQILSSILRSGGFVDNKHDMDLLEKSLLKHCCYEQRKKRSNYSNKLVRLGCLA